MTSFVRRPLTVVAALSAALAASAVSLVGVGTSDAAAPTAAAAAPAPCPTQAAHPWCDRSLSPDRRALLFQRAMTRDEEVTLVGGDSFGASPHTGATFAIPRLGLRAVYFSDGPVGPRQGDATAMPIPMALAATWDQRLARTHGREIADEVKHKGNDVVFAPTVNIMRTPQGGRTYEGYGEDTFLVGRTAVSWIRGAESAGVIADVKHFLANNQEGQDGVPPITSTNGGRQVVNVNAAERTLREVYMPQFEAAVKQAHVGTIMCSYNRVNGAYACENHHTLQQVLEKEWRFKGIVLADYGASKDTVGNLNNGLDFVPDQGQADQSYDPRAVTAALDSGAVTRATLDAHVRRILRTLFAYGVFDRPGYVDDDGRIDVAAHQRTARRTEERAITLLKNDGVLPLKPGVRKIAVIGPYADRFITGGGSGAVSARRVVTALEGIRTRAGKRVQVTYADGSDQAAAAAAAKAADVAVVVVGDVETEGQDKDCIGLNCTNDLANSESVLVTQNSSCGVQTCPLNGTDEDGLVSSVAAAQKRTVVVLETGAPVLTPWRHDVAAVVEAWYPGQEGGTALAHVLFGDVDPGGRLPVTFPASAAQLQTAGDPNRYPGVAEQVDYSEGVLTGYKWYDAHHLTPAYPFGAGLSYTHFRYGALHVRRAAGPDRVAVASLTVTNTGRRAGVAVPQLYLGKPATAALPQPVRQLVGYTSVRVPAGRTVRVDLPLNDRSFATWGAHGWRVLPGCYRLSAGSSSRHLTSGATVARGATCAGSALSLGTRARLFLPLPPVARVHRVG
ncbi:MAG: beta-glucosidase [Nocardioides sp.]